MRKSSIGYPLRVGPITWLIVVLAIAGCSGDKVASPHLSPEEPLPNNSEFNVLQNLALAFENRNLEDYEAGFDGSRFIFRFEVGEAARDPSIPSSWNWEEDFASVQNLFENPAVSDIDLSFAIGVASPVRETGTYPSDWSTVSVSEVELAIKTKSSTGGELVVHKVSGGEATFVFKPYPDEPVDGQPRLRIEEWVDRGVSAPGGSSTWGAIKTLFQDRHWLPNTVLRNLIKNDTDRFG